MNNTPAATGWPRLILASASPRRVELLEQIGLRPGAVVPADVDESALPRETPVAMARRLAEAKARAVADRFPNDFVLAADTVVACGRRVLPKPDDERQARSCLGLLSGRRHRVVGGVAVIDPAGRAHGRVVTTVVTFKRLEESDIAAYIELGEWRDKAGAYGIQGRAAVFVRRINGSYSNVVGLPLFETSNMLKGAGFQPQST